MDIVFRRALKKDVLDIFYVESRCFNSPWSLDSIKQDIKYNPAALYIVAVQGKKVVGFSAMHAVLDEGHIMNVAVLNEYRGKHIGERLIKKMFELSPPQVSNYTLEVRVSNSPAISLYTKLGFKSFGLRPGYYADTGESAMIMWLNKA